MRSPIRASLVRALLSILGAVALLGSSASAQGTCAGCRLTHIDPGVGLTDLDAPNSCGVLQTRVTVTAANNGSCGVVGQNACIQVTPCNVRVRWEYLASSLCTGLTPRMRSSAGCATFGVPATLPPVSNWTVIRHRWLRQNCNKSCTYTFNLDRFGVQVASVSVQATCNTCQYFPVGPQED